MDVLYDSIEQLKKDLYTPLLGTRENRVKTCKPGDQKNQRIKLFFFLCSDLLFIFSFFFFFKMCSSIHNIDKTEISTYCNTAFKHASWHIEKIFGQLVPHPTKIEKWSHLNFLSHKCLSYKKLKD